MSPRPDVSDIRRPQILAAAKETFSQNGIDATTMQEVADACDLSKASIYRYFESKEDLVLALLNDLYEKDEQLIAVLTDPSMSVDDRLTEYTGSFVKRLDDDPDLATLYFDFYSHARRVNDLKERTDAYYAMYKNAFLTLIEHGIAEGRFQPAANVRIEDAALGTIAMIEGFSLIGYLYRENFGPRLTQVIESFITNLQTCEQA